MDCINAFQEELNKVEGYKDLIYEKIVDMRFCYEYDEYYDSFPTLYLSLLLKSADDKIKKVVKSRYFNVYCLEFTGDLEVSSELIMKDTYQKNGGTIDARYYIHDNGYGDNKFKSIKFYCGSFKLIEVTDYVK